MEKSNIKKIIELKERTGASMVLCKKIFNEMNGDIELAFKKIQESSDNEHNKTNIAKKAAKKENRETKEGLIGVSINDDLNKGSMIVLSCETDFVSRNEKFIQLLQKITQCTTEVNSSKELLEYKINNTPVKEHILNDIALMGENITISNYVQLSAAEGIVGKYIYREEHKGLGRIITLISIESNAPKQELQELSSIITRHITAINPKVISIEDLDKEYIKTEKQNMMKQLSNKPAKIVEKIIEGKMNKIYQTSVLLEQSCLGDEENKIKDIIAKFQKQHDCELKITNFIRFSTM